MTLACKKPRKREKAYIKQKKYITQNNSWNVWDIKKGSKKIKGKSLHIP